MNAITPGRSDVFAALRAFLLDVLPEGVDAVAGLPNRVAAPQAANFVVMSALRSPRLRTNVDTADDCRFTASIAFDSAAFTGSIARTKPASPSEMPSGTMTVTAVSSGVIRAGQLVAGVGVLAATYVVAQLSGTAGGAGTYLVTKAQEIVPGSPLTSSCGIMTVTAVDWGTILLGALVFGTGAAVGTKIRAFGTGAGGVGTYVVSPGQTLSSRLLAASGKLLETASNFVVQLDFHSYDLDSAADMAATVQASFRDPYAYAFFADSFPHVAPLYADDPRLAPFVNENGQVESRWILEASLQVNQTTRVPAQYADAVSVTIVSVDAAYPP